MAYDEALAERVRQALRRVPGIEEKKMFGGLAFLLRGNMCCGVTGDELMVRVGPDGYAAALAGPHAREMNFTGRALRGFVYVERDGFATPDALALWVGRGVAFAKSLPPK